MTWGSVTTTCMYQSYYGYLIFGQCLWIEKSWELRENVTLAWWAIMHEGCISVRKHATWTI